MQVDFMQYQRRAQDAMREVVRESLAMIAEDGLMGGHHVYIVFDTGVPGVGPKTAAALMKEFASLEELYDNLDRVAEIPVRGAGKLAAKLAGHREAAFLARRLTEIACDMPLEIGRPELSRRAPDLAALTDFFDRHNFGPMLRRQAERLATLPLRAAVTPATATN